MVDSRPAALGQPYNPSTTVTLDNQPLALPDFTYLAFHKPTGYVVSRVRQGADPTIYDLLPPQYYQLKPVGRLDRDSSGLLVLTNDGVLANRLAHPSAEKTKTYQITLDRPLTDQDLTALSHGVKLADGLSQLLITSHHSRNLTAELHEGRNRQIRRTFEALGYEVIVLHRTSFGKLQIGDLVSGEWRQAQAGDLL